MKTRALLFMSLITLATLFGYALYIDKVLTQAASYRETLKRYDTEMYRLNESCEADKLDMAAHLAGWCIEACYEWSK